MEARQFQACFDHFCDNRAVLPPLRVALYSLISEQPQKVEVLDNPNDAFEFIERVFEGLMASNETFLITMPLPWGEMVIQVQPRQLNRDTYACLLKVQTAFSIASHHLAGCEIILLGVSVVVSGEQEEQEGGGEAEDPETRETFRRLMSTLKPPEASCGESDEPS